MKKLKVNVARAILALMLATIALPAMAETFKKLHASAPQLIVNSTSFNDTNEPTSSTVDLAGADLDKISFLVNCSSAVGSAASVSYALQVSPDGGTTWIPTGDTMTVSTSATTTTAYLSNKATNGGTKARMVPTLTGSTTFYTFKMWAMPNTD